MTTPAGPEVSDGPYDVNFCFPVRELENSKIKLTPFIVGSQYSFKKRTEDAVALNSHPPTRIYSSKAAQIIQSFSNTFPSVLMAPHLT